MNAEQAVFELAEALLHSAGSSQSPVVQALAQALTRLPEAELRQSVLQALRAVDDPDCLAAVWQVWAETRHADLETLLKQANQAAERPLALRVLTALKLGQASALTTAGAEIIEPLLAAALDADLEIAEQAHAALRSLADPAAQEELCRWVIEHDHPQARQAALQAGFMPRQLQRRALFFLLTEQWERYESLDFDASLLHAVHQAAGEDLRRKIAGLARQAGWGGYVQALAGEHGPRRLEALNAAEWEVILALSGRGQRWEETWQLAQAAPPWWSARLLQKLHEAGWSPATQEARQEFHALAQAGMDCLAQGAPFAKLPRALQPLSGAQRTAQRGEPGYRPPPATVIAFSRRGERLACGSADRSISLWDIDTGELHSRLEGHSGVVIALAFSPDGELLASGSADRTLRLWQTGGQATPQILGGHGGEVAALAFSPDGALLGSGDPKALRLWEMPEGRLRHLLPVEEWGTLSLAFNPEGSLLGSAHAGNALRLWDIAAGEALGSLMERVSCWTFLPGGKLATGSTYGQARLWQATPSALLQTLEGHIDGAQFAASPDGQILAASDNNCIRLWQLPGGAPLAVLEGHPQRVTALAFSPDGSLLVSGGGDIRLWQLAPIRLIRATGGFTGAIRQLAFSPNSACLACLDAEKPHLLALDDVDRLLKAPAGRFSALAAQEIVQRRSAQEGDLPRRERAWLEFAVQLHARHSRFDIEIEERRTRITVGEFDIEIGG